MNETQAVSALGALAHTQRLRVFRALVVAGPERIVGPVTHQRYAAGREQTSVERLVEFDREGAHRGARRVADLTRHRAGIDSVRDAVEASARSLTEDPAVPGSTLTAVCAQIVARTRILVGLVAAGFVVTIALAVWWVRAG